MKKESNNNGGIGFLGVLSIMFIGLKLTGNITWSWLWVMGPMWIPAVSVGIIALIYVVWHD